jgi:hypothetical protein
MADITYCDNKECSFKACERHPTKISEACIKGKGYVSVASFEGRCSKYRRPKERGGEK